jgi:hypothetical protein
MGVDPRTYCDLTEQPAINKIISEFEKSGTQSDQQIINGLLNGSYCNPGEPGVPKPPPLLSLAKLMVTEPLERLKKHGLQSHHVLAIRTYTTSCYMSINGPMRKKPHVQLPHPFAATMYYITTGLKILRAAQGEDEDASREQCFYRGLTDMQVSDDFRKMGGTEMSCMSTTDDINVAAGFAGGAAPLIFKYLSNDFMSSGARLWDNGISVYPNEKEVMYPPLTYLSCPTAGLTEIKINGRMYPVVEVRPTYPET